MQSFCGKAVCLIEEEKSKTGLRVRYRSMRGVDAGIELMDAREEEAEGSRGQDEFTIQFWPPPDRSNLRSNAKSGTYIPNFYSYKYSDVL